MGETRIKGFAGILMLSAVLAAAPALAADVSGMAGRAAAWEKAYNADDLKAVAALYSADGCRMPPHAKIAQGTEGILAQLKAGKDQGAARVKLAVTMAETSGNRGYGAGTWAVMGADGKVVDEGKWMNHSRMVKGKWKIQCDIWNSDLPVPAAKAK
jgi:ketosteroid isomerase-like protein